MTCNSNRNTSVMENNCRTSQLQWMLSTVKEESGRCEQCAKLRKREDNIHGRGTKTEYVHFFTVFWPFRETKIVSVMKFIFESGVTEWTWCQSLNQTQQIYSLLLWLKLCKSNNMLTGTQKYSNIYYLDQSQSKLICCLQITIVICNHNTSH